MFSKSNVKNKSDIEVVAVRVCKTFSALKMIFVYFDQALNFMAAGGGLPTFPPARPLSHANGSAHLASPLTGLTGAARPTSTPATPTNAFAGRPTQEKH
jgi:hypothetical protein